MIARLLFWAALCFAVVMAALPQPLPIPGEPSDKVLHIVAFSVLAALGALAYPRAGLLRLGVALSILGAGIEFAQTIPLINRDAQLGDWFADTLAVLVVLGLIAIARRCRGKISS